MTDRRVKSIVVVGGGTAGWLAATLLIDRIPPHAGTKITLVESKDIPVIGVGESTTAQLRYLLRNTHYLRNEEDFLVETGATYKYGILHEDWHTVGESFVSPLGGDFDNVTRFPHDKYDYMRIYHIAKKFDYRHVYQSRCMIDSKVFYVEGERNNPYPEYIRESGYTFLDTTDVAYHIDAYETGAFFRRKAVETGKIERVEGTIKEVKRDENGYVESLILEDGTHISGDLFFDCTGFSRVLKSEDNKFVSYSDKLLLDGAVLFPKEVYEGEEIRTYTKAKAMKNGWAFEIPLQRRLGRGYNFSSSFTDETKVVDELNEVYGEEDVNVRGVIKYEPGRLSRFWDKNVVYTGISSGFLEPLEATTIHSTIKQVEHFLEVYYSDLIDVRNDALRNQYNRDMEYFYDDLRDLIIFHYQNTRQDTDFWVESSKSDKLSDKLARNMELWKTRMPRIQDFSDGPMINFLGLGNALWYQVAMGMHILDSDLAQKELEYYGLLSLAEKEFKDAVNVADYLTSRSMPAKDFYKLLRETHAS